MSDQTQKRKLSLEDTKLSKRIWSWIFFVGILMLFLIVPLVSLINEDTADVLRDSPLPSDNSWSSGHLSVAHQIPELNQNCGACHVNSFERVQDESCLSCHADTNHHFDTLKHDASVLDGARCASCHLEHEEPANIIREDDKLCVDCHRAMSADGLVETELVDVDSFGAEQRSGGKQAPHPAFKVSMLVPEGKADRMTWSLRRTALANNPVEQSNLVFPHDVHVDPAGLKGPDGLTVLACSDCHVTDDAGKLMLPINMENHCSSCHSLTFDPQAPDRELPHADPDTVMLALEEFYARQFLRQRFGRDPSAQELREFVLRRPGQSSPASSRADQLDLDSPWGKATNTAQEVFEKTTCKICHEVSIDDSGDYLSKWRVDPIKITAHWMPKSDFDHFSHRTFNCALCHDANSSSVSSDVLMPDLPVCEACHTGERTHENKLPSSCVSCHQFHLPDQQDWGQAVTRFDQSFRHHFFANGGSAHYAETH
ncbi:MAG: cytochrome c3 family protein [Pseudomonadota bacterium]